MRLQAERPLYVAEAKRCRRPKFRGRWRRRSGADGPSSANGGFIAVGVENTKSNKCRPRDPIAPYSLRVAAKGQATSSESKKACRVSSRVFAGLRGTSRDFAGLRGTLRDFAGLRGTSRDFGEIYINKKYQPQGKKHKKKCSTQWARGAGR